MGIVTGTILQPQQQQSTTSSSSSSSKLSLRSQTHRRRSSYHYTSRNPVLFTMLQMLLDHNKLLMGALSMGVYLLAQQRQSNKSCDTSNTECHRDLKLSQSSKSIIYGIFQLVLCIFLLRQVVGIDLIHPYNSVKSFLLTTRGASSLQLANRLKDSFVATTRSSSLYLFGYAPGGSTRAGGKIKRELAISAKDFAPLDLDTIEELSLDDIKTVFDYSINMNRDDFDRRKYARKEGLTEECKKALAAINTSVSSSKSFNVELSSVSRKNKNDFGTVDTLALLAALRIFAEWRVLRLVPEGYNAYAMGMNMARKDLVQNIGKVEAAVHRYLDDMQQSTTTTAESDTSTAAATTTTTITTITRSPTVYELLDWEKRNGIHKSLPKLQDNSGALGLLWALRQLAYQVNIFENIVNVPKVFPTGKDAVAAAYKSVYADYHGFFVRQIFQKSFAGAPDAHVIIQHMNSVNSETSDQQTSSSSDQSSSEGDTGVEQIETIVIEPKGQRQPENPIEALGMHLGKEIAKFEQLFGLCGGAMPPSPLMDAVVAAEDVKITKKTVQVVDTSSHENLKEFLSIVKPALEGLEQTIKSLNMNDPTKV